MVTANNDDISVQAFNRGLKDMNAHFEFVLILSEFLWPFGADVSSSLSVVTGTCWPLRFIKTLCPDTSRLVLITGKDTNHFTNRQINAKEML